MFLKITTAVLLWLSVCLFLSFITSLYPNTIFLFDTLLLFFLSVLLFPSVKRNPLCIAFFFIKKSTCNNHQNNFFPLQFSRCEKIDMDHLTTVRVVALDGTMNFDKGGNYLADVGHLIWNTSGLEIGET